MAPDRSAWPASIPVSTIVTVAAFEPLVVSHAVVRLAPPLVVAPLAAVAPLLVVTVFTVPVPGNRFHWLANQGSAGVEAARRMVSGDTYSNWPVDAMRVATVCASATDITFGSVTTWAPPDMARLYVTGSWAAADQRCTVATSAATDCVLSVLLVPLFSLTISCVTHCSRVSVVLALPVAKAGAA